MIADSTPCPGAVNVHMPLVQYYNWNLDKLDKHSIYSTCLQITVETSVKERFLHWHRNFTFCKMHTTVQTPIWWVEMGIEPILVEDLFWTVRFLGIVRQFHRTFARWHVFDWNGCEMELELRKSEELFHKFLQLNYSSRRRNTIRITFSVPSGSRWYQ